MAESGSPVERILKRGKQIGVVKDLERPWGLTMNNNHIVVTESDKECVTICNKEGDKVLTFGSRGGKQGEFMSPLAVAITKDNHIVVADKLRVQKFTLTGEFVKSISSRKLSYDSPFAMSVHPSTGDIYIVDSEKHNVLVITEDLVFVRTFGTKGSEAGQFNKPRNIAINNQGIVYVVDYNNDRVCKFTSDGEYLASLGTPGCGAGEIDRPSAVAVDADDFVYVTEMVNGRVFVFDSKDTFVHCFGKCGSGEGQFSAPQGIVVDSQGDIIVSDTYNNRIVIV